MTKQELIQQLNNIYQRQTTLKFDRDLELDHMDADDLLLKYINDPEVTEAFENIDKWYA